MSDATLVWESGQGVEPFNSAAFSEVVSRGSVATGSLRERVARAGDYLSLLALRRIDPAAFRAEPTATRSGILVEALRNSDDFNLWGVPHLYWEEAAEAVIEMGGEAIPGLAGLLSDKRRAPMWGSEEAGESAYYQYRVADYAWALMMEIRNERREVPIDPGVRDSLIALEIDRSQPVR
jgi:hypothetical protein